MIKCPKCKTNNIQIQVVNETRLKRKRRSFIMWVLFWWWVEILMWVFLTLPRIIIMLFGSKKQKIVNTTVKKGVCQNCGNVFSL